MEDMLFLYLWDKYKTKGHRICAFDITESQR